MESVTSAEQTTCSICGKELSSLKMNPCYDCTYTNPLFWCYKHSWFSHNRTPCPGCQNKQQKDCIICGKPFYDEMPLDAENHGPCFSKWLSGEY